ncbi:Drug/metabolite transporter [Artemisia annua]|uniref:Drug/metabolite transporter n=1 Tax=Artemisia annua TaxID=35608 RepID=A0A2U1P5Z0_ARTAN|nr:Drug/metabolite transporter [Artemisia annua]
MAFILRLEMVNLRSIRSQAKVTGTKTTVGGAMLMTLVKGPMLELFWTKGRTNINDVNNGEDLSHSIKAITLKSYPAELSLTAWICLLGTDEGAIVALVTEKAIMGSIILALKKTYLGRVLGAIVVLVELYLVV